LASAAATNTADVGRRPKSFEDVMVELGIGMDLLIDRLDKAFDAGFELDMDVSGDVMDAIIAARWVAHRLNDTSTM
jgi:hypothetical protein